MISWLQKIAEMSGTVILVHGWDGGPTKNWFPWLSESLRDVGYFVLNMSMPNPAKPNRQIWVKHLQDHTIVDSNTIIVAYSIGCMAVLRFLEKSSSSPKALILIAPFAENEKKYKTVRSFFYGKLNWKKIGKCPNIYTLHSDNDPFVSLWQRLVFKDEVNATNIVQKDQGHFDGDKIPKVLDIIKGLYCSPQCQQKFKRRKT